MSNPAFQLEHEMASALKGIDFPADREEIVRQAKANGASSEVLKAFDRLRDGDYDNVAQVMGASARVGDG
jgi:hypothetical protein